MSEYDNVDGDRLNCVKCDNFITEIDGRGFCPVCAEFEKQEKITRFKQAISQICLDGRKRGYFEYNFDDSFRVACGEISSNEFAREPLVKVFKTVIEKFKKDINDRFISEIVILDVATQLNFASLQHAI